MRRTAKNVAVEEVVAGKDGTADDQALIADGIHLSRTQYGGQHASGGRETGESVMFDLWTSVEASFVSIAVKAFGFVPLWESYLSAKSQTLVRPAPFDHQQYQCMYSVGSLLSHANYTTFECGSFGQ
jgi:hypothetical protein